MAKTVGGLMKRKLAIVYRIIKSHLSSCSLITTKSSNHGP